MIREYELTADGLDPLAWYAVSREYEDGDAARAAWEELQDADEIRGGELELGIYRHGTEDGTPCLVTAVGHRREGVEEADRILQGTDFDLPDEWAQALILRRIDVLALQLVEGAPSTLKIRRGRGAKIRPDGTVDEFIGGENGS